MIDPEVVNEINSLSHEQMARLWRFAPTGHKYFDSTKPYYDIFNKRFDEFGGITPEISNRIGWEQ